MRDPDDTQISRIFIWLQHMSFHTLKISILNTPVWYQNFFFCWLYEVEKLLNDFTYAAAFLNDTQL